MFIIPPDGKERELMLRDMYINNS